MSARRRRRRNRSDDGQDQQQNNQQQSRSRNRRRRSRGGGGGHDSPRSARERAREKPKDEGLIFWGDPEKLPEPRPDVRITDDPSAVPRSLGTPPLPGQEKVAVHYFTAVYDRAVNVAGALAAAGGLIDPTALAGDDTDEE